MPITRQLQVNNDVATAVIMAFGEMNSALAQGLKK
jgi:hypothetical protein